MNLLRHIHICPLLTSLGILLLLGMTHPTLAAHAGKTPTAKRLLMAHYLPWYQAKPFSKQWGWHWTMNHFAPDHHVHGRPDIASQYTPLIGPYDSNDPDALECQVMLMKLSGIDGVIIDWYGNDDFLDYGAVNRNTQRLIPILQRAGLRFAICYEDQTVPKEIAGGVFTQPDAVAHGQRMMQWMQTHFFSSPAYLTQEGRPVLLSFGTPYYDNSQWNTLFSVLPRKPLYFTELDRREPTASIGSFDWALPSGGTAQALQQQVDFLKRAQFWPMFIPVAFPRFHDIYQKAGVSSSYGTIDDQNGQTYEETLTRALQSGAPIVQIVSWNDWGEGTQIEPSVEFGDRDLVTTQRLRRQYRDPHFHGTAQDLSLPIDWYHLRKKYAGNTHVEAELSTVFPLVVSGHIAQVRALLARCAR
jgi:hypothetical protein